MEIVINVVGEICYYQIVKIFFVDDNIGEVKELIGVVIDIIDLKEIEYWIK